MPVDDSGQDPFGADVPLRDPRLTSLDARLDAASQAEKIRSGAARPGSDKGYNQGSRVLAELIAGPAGGALIGWLLDRWLGTTPWALLVLLILGFGAAMWNIYRISCERPK